MSPPVREDGGQPVKVLGHKNLQKTCFLADFGYSEKIAIGMTSGGIKNFGKEPPHCGGREIDESDLD